MRRPVQKRWQGQFEDPVVVALAALLLPDLGRPVRCRRPRRETDSSRPFIDLCCTTA